MGFSEKLFKKMNGEPTGKGGGADRSYRRAAAAYVADIEAVPAPLEEE